MLRRAVMSTNPYQSPQATTKPTAAEPKPRSEGEVSLRQMTIYLAMVVTIAALLGCVVGIGIGTAAPEYYRAVFRVGPDPNFHPAAIGGVLGLLQGGALGLAVGLILIVVHYWYSL